MNPTAGPGCMGRRCCPRIRPPRFAIVFGIVIGTPCQLDVGSRCTVRCASGYSSALTTKPSMTMTCMRNRRWNANSGAMRCTRRRQEEDSLRPWINVRTNETRKIG